MPDLVSYRVSLARRHRHLYDVEVRVPATGDSVDFKLPVWTPGSYLVREYARHLQDLVAHDETERRLVVRKTDKATWRVTLDGATEVRARYSVYAHELTVRTSHLDDSHAYWNGATLFLYVDALARLPHRVTVTDIPAGWQASTSLTIEPSLTNTHVSLSAPDHDTLVDSPVEIGQHERHRFTLAGRSHELALWGKSDLDRGRLLDDVQRIIGAHAALFGELPYERYVFLLHLVPGGYGGLEHRSSCSLLSSPFAHRQSSKYLDLLELISHEFFHTWNGKRIRPLGLGPFDYQREAYTRSLWVVEGWTSYYDRLMLRRAAIMNAERYLEKLGEDLSKLATISGRRKQSLEEASFDAWIKFYRPDENTSNTTVSYYLKGSIVALLLDLEIRRRSAGAHTLDEVVRLLWEEHGRRDRGYDDGAIEQIIERVAGVAVADFFAQAVRGREELDMEQTLASVGLRCQVRARPNDDGAWLGASLGAELKVSDVSDDSPAQEAGLSPGDQLVAWDGWRLSESQLKEHLAHTRPGTQVRLTLFRRDQLRELTVTLGGPARTKLEVVALPEATAAERAAYHGWLGVEWPPRRERE